MSQASSTSVRILIVEDDEIDAAQTRRLLSQSALSEADIRWAGSLEEALRMLATGEFDVMLLDLNLPDSNGLSTLVAVHKVHPRIAKIVVTGHGGEELGCKAVSQGAQDYLVKEEFDTAVLTRAIRYSLERKKSEQALWESRSKLNAMLESLSDPTVMIDRTLTIIWANEANRQLFGDDAEGCKCYAFYHNRDKPCGPSDCMVVRAFRDGQAHHQDIQIADAQGRDRCFHWTANVALRDCDNMPTTVIAVARDITERKTSEENLIVAYTQVERANRELREMQSQLVQSEKLASIGQLAAGVAHEMNTPVGFVACNFETLDAYLKEILELLALYHRLADCVEGADKIERLRTLQQIKEAKRQMQFDRILDDLQGLFEDSREGLSRVTNIIQNLRYFSRLDQAGDLAAYSVNDGIRATLTVARNEIKYDAEVKTEFDDVPLVFCNSGQVNQVFLNILVNAAQAIRSQAREMPGTIVVRTYCRDSDVVCEIEDDGPGIPQDKVSRVFDPFYTTKPAGKGTGLGLSVSYDIIVNKHKGQLSVESEEGRGTKFTIVLPVNSHKLENLLPETARTGECTDG
jgi:PAS domain S-box-containing protein